MNNDLYLSGHFLIAMPSMQDSNFAHAVVYICEHNINGAIGLVINQPIEDLRLGYVFQQTAIDVQQEAINQLPLLRGGPLQQERGFVLHRPVGSWRSSLIINDDLAVTTSQDVLEAVACGEGPDQLLVALGYTGWGGSQLEEELAKTNSWISCPANTDILFNTPFVKRWESAAALLGVDINTLTGHSGNA